MYKYVLIANGEIKQVYKWDELSDAINAYEYTKQFYPDTTLSVMKYSEDTHSIILIKCNIEKGNKDVLSCSWQ